MFVKRTSGSKLVLFTLVGVTLALDMKDVDGRVPSLTEGGLREGEVPKPSVSGGTPVPLRLPGRKERQGSELRSTNAKLHPQIVKECRPSLRLSCVAG